MRKLIAMISLICITGGAFSQTRDKCPSPRAYSLSDHAKIFKMICGTDYWAFYTYPDTAKSLFHVHHIGRTVVIDHIPNTLFMTMDTIVIFGRKYIFQESKEGSR